MFMKTNNSTRHGREILSNQYSINRLLFTELSLWVSPPTLGEVSRKSQQIPKSKGANPVVPLRPLLEWGMVLTYGSKRFLKLSVVQDYINSGKKKI